MYAQIALVGAEAASKYGPKVYELAKQQLRKVTGGKVKDVAQLAQYVGQSPQRLKIATEALVTAGVPADAVIPTDMIGENQVLARIRQSAQTLMGQMQSQYAAGSDKSLAGSSDDIARDVIRKKRVATALRIYGSAQAYFLVHPQGGIPAEDFVWFDRVIKDR